MTGKYQGKDIKAQRPAKQGDPGFDPNKGEQVVITMQDGSEKVVAKSEVTQS
jgi:hypothetical protein